MRNVPLLSLQVRLYISVLQSNGDSGPELVMGWVHPWVGLCQSYFFNFWWVGLGGDLTA